MNTCVFDVNVGGPFFTCTLVLHCSPYCKYFKLTFFCQIAYSKTWRSTWFGRYKWYWQINCIENFGRETKTQLGALWSKTITTYICMYKCTSITSLKLMLSNYCVFGTSSLIVMWVICGFYSMTYFSGSSWLDRNLDLLQGIRIAKLLHKDSWRWPESHH